MTHYTIKYCIKEDGNYIEVMPDRASYFRVFQRTGNGLEWARDFGMLSEANEFIKKEFSKALLNEGKITFKENKNGCWECTSHKPYTISRWIFKQLYGNISKNVVVRHKCDNPLCINPAHLESRTVPDNITFQLDDFCDLCNECDHYHHIPARMYLSNGDPGYPAEDYCDKDFECDLLECREEYDEDAIECCSCSVGRDKCPFKENEEEEDE